MPDDIDFATKPALATGMLTRALDAGVLARWATGDEVYGIDPGLRADCEAQRIGYVLAVGCDRRVPTAAGPMRADALVAGLPRWAWQQLSAGSGAKGERCYDWAWITLTPDSHTDSDTGCWWLPRPGHQTTDELAFYRCYSPKIVPVRELVRVAGRRWTVEEESFQAGKGLAGLDERQVRRWASWRRWTFAGDARSCVARGDRRQRAHRPTRPDRHDPVDVQRDPPPTGSSGRRTPPRPNLPAHLVELAPTPPAPIPNQPLQASAKSSPTVITIYGWSIRAPVDGSRRDWRPRRAGTGRQAARPARAHAAATAQGRAAPPGAALIKVQRI